MSKNTKKLKDGYVRPKTTQQDLLSTDEIKKLLIGYTVADDIFKVPLNSHIRYLTVKDGKKVFRMGGYLFKHGENKEYVVLNSTTNGKKINWSVQVKNTIFYVKANPVEQITEQNNKLKEDFSNYKQAFKELQRINKELENKLKNEVHKRRKIEKAFT